MTPLLKNIALGTLVILAVLFVYKLRQSPDAAPDLMDSIRFTDALRAGKIASVTLPRDATVGGELVRSGPNGKPARFIIATPAYRDLVDDLLRQNVSVEFISPRESSLLVTFLSWVPMLVLIGIWLYFLRAMQAARRKQDGNYGTPVGS